MNELMNSEHVAGSMNWNFRICGMKQLGKLVSTGKGWWSDQDDQN